MSSSQEWTPGCITFSRRCGRNIKIVEGICASGQYRLAQGQFMLKHPLRKGQEFFIYIKGTGTLRFYTYNFKDEALDWLSSLKPLSVKSKCIRLDESDGKKRYQISYPTVGLICINGKTCFETLESPFLVFDLEYGNLIVKLKDAPDGIQFDTENCGQHVSISPNMAQLTHFNPSALCITAKPIVVTGSKYILEATWPEGSGNVTVHYLRFGLLEKKPETKELHGTEDFPPQELCTGTVTVAEASCIYHLYVGSRGVQIKSHTGNIEATLEAPMQEDKDVRKYFLCLELHNVEVQVKKVVQSIKTYPDSDSGSSSWPDRSSISDACLSDSHHQTPLKGAYDEQQNVAQSSSMTRPKHSPLDTHGCSLRSVQNPCGGKSSNKKSGNSTEDGNVTKNSHKDYAYSKNTNDFYCNGNLGAVSSSAKKAEPRKLLNIPTEAVALSMEENRSQRTSTTSSRTNNLFVGSTQPVCHIPVHKMNHPSHSPESSKDNYEAGSGNKHRSVPGQSACDGARGNTPAKNFTTVVVNDKGRDHHSGNQTGRRSSHSASDISDSGDRRKHQEGTRQHHLSGRSPNLSDQASRPEQQQQRQTQQQQPQQQQPQQQPQQQQPQQQPQQQQPQQQQQHQAQQQSHYPKADINVVIHVDQR